MENSSEKSMVGAWIWLILGIVYAFFPIDVLPDVVPFVGWVDDLLITGTGVLNFIQAICSETNETLASIMRLLKWVIIILGVIAVGILLIFGSLIAKLFS